MIDSNVYKKSFLRNIENAEVSEMIERRWVSREAQDEMGWNVYT